MTPAEAYSQPRRAPHGSSLLEKAVILHFSILLVFASWAFGGQSPWARQVIAIWGGFGVLLFFASLRSTCRDETERKGGRAVLHFFWPLVIYDLLVGISGFNPSFAEIPGAG